MFRHRQAVAHRGGDIVDGDFVGFLGVGAKNVAVPFDKLNVTRKPNSATIDKITVAFSKDELKNAPTFAFFEPEKSTTTGSAAPERPRGISPIGGPAPSAPSK